MRNLTPCDDDFRGAVLNKKQYQELISEINKHDRLYYSEAKPSISDYEYDQLVKSLEAIEKKHPEWITSSSPTQRIGESLTKGFKQVAHEAPMLSLANTYSEKEIADYIKRVHKLLGHKNVTFCAELKMDGVAITARYEKGKFVRALTRGDGRKGDDITANLKTSTVLPLKLKGSNIPDVVEFRGEAFMFLDNFRKLNQMREEEGHEPFANPRNATAGSLKMLNPAIVSRRKIKVIFYSLAENHYKYQKTQYATHQWLNKLGLPSFAERHHKRCHNLEEILKFADKVDAERKKLPFEIDGIVIKVDELSSHPKLGKTGKSPRYAVAYKFAPEQAETKIEDITVQVGRTGVLTPVAELKPVPLAGSKISRATLHNADEIKRKDIRIGDTVTIEKGGDVIPKVVKVEKKKRPRSSKLWHMPKKCPSCNTPTVHVKGEVAIRCPNKKGCPDQKLSRLIFFASKGAMDIEHLGVKVVEQLVKNGLIASIPDIYNLTYEDLEKLEGFKEKSINNLLDSIDASRECTLARLIFALGIKFVGIGAAEILAAEAKSLENLAKMDIDDLKDLEGIGDKTAESVVAFFKDPAHLKEIELLYKAGVKPKKMAKPKTGHAFSGKTFVLTGTLDNYTRDEASDLIKARGGHVSSSVSKNTDYLLLGDNPGSKYDKAKKIGVTILDEKTFTHKLK